MIQPDPFRFTNWCEQHGDVNQDVKRVTNIYTLLPVWSSYMTNLLKLVHRKLKNILRKKKKYSEPSLIHHQVSTTISWPILFRLYPPSPTPGVF